MFFIIISDILINTIIMGASRTVESVQWLAAD
jgi:hypothetical protein